MKKTEIGEGIKRVILSAAAAAAIASFCFSNAFAQSAPVSQELEACTVFEDGSFTCNALHYNSDGTWSTDEGQVFILPTYNSQPTGTWEPPVSEQQNIARQAVSQPKVVETKVAPKETKSVDCSKLIHVAAHTTSKGTEVKAYDRKHAGC